VLAGISRSKWDQKTLLRERHGHADGLVFISCGQVTEAEKKLGDDVCRLVRELTPFEPYFAQSQHSLEGLTKNILEGLARSVGLIAIMHPRGRVASPSGNEHIRASVWIEQEIAIAAFITQALKRQIQIATCIPHEHIQRGDERSASSQPVSIYTRRRGVRTPENDAPEMGPCLIDTVVGDNP
jgi:hypothetical protein